jgi:hypothetical protein
MDFLDLQQLDRWLNGCTILDPPLRKISSLHALYLLDLPLQALSVTGCDRVEWKMQSFNGGNGCI